nr:MAG TPA_asm: hypothetical protein [Caudoviricetes sp.]
MNIFMLPASWGSSSGGDRGPWLVQTQAFELLG